MDDELSEVRTLAAAIERNNSSHDEESALAAAQTVERVLDEEIGLETIYLRRMLLALAQTVEGGAL